MAVLKEICKTNPQSHDCRRGWPHAEGCASTSTGWRLSRRGTGWLFFLVMGWVPLLQSHPIWSYGSHLLILQNHTNCQTIPNHILKLRWPLSSKETLRKRPVEESRCPSPLVRSNTLSSIQRPEKLDQVNSANLLFELWSLVSYVIEFVAQNNCREGHWYMMVLGQYRAVLAGIWWYWVSMGQYWLVLGDTGSV